MTIKHEQSWYFQHRYIADVVKGEDNVFVQELFNHYLST